MAVAQLLFAIAACIAVAEASNSTNGTTTTNPSTSTYAATTTTLGATTTTDGSGDNVTTTTGALQEQITGSLILSIVGSCSAFVSDDSVKLAVRKTIAGVATIDVGFVAITMTHSCSRRLAKMGSARRLDGAVTVNYVITLPLGHSTTAASIVNIISSTTPAAWTTALTTQLSAEGVTAFTASVTSATAPVVGTVSAFTTTTVTTTLAAGVDSSALTTAVLSSAHLWALLAIFVVTKF